MAGDVLSAGAGTTRDERASQLGRQGLLGTVMSAGDGWYGCEPGRIVGQGWRGTERYVGSEGPGAHGVGMSARPGVYRVGRASRHGVTRKGLI